VIGTRGTRRLLPIYCTLALMFLVLPTLLVIPIGFTSSQFLEFPPPGYSLQWFETYFSSPVWLSATLRSFGVAAATAICATLIGGLAALALARSNTRWGGLVFATFLAPLIVPRIIIAVGLFYLFARIGLVATDLGLVIGHTVLALPFAFVTITAILKNYDWRLDQAAAVLGANRIKTLLLITVPLVKGGLVAAFLFAFITSFDELTIAIFVSGGIKTTLPKQMWDDMILQLNPTLAAVSVVVFVIVTVLLLLAERFRRTT
jgi:putative spermidine/putrescine transport system permease protein